MILNSIYCIHISLKSVIAQKDIIIEEQQRQNDELTKQNEKLKLQYNDLLKQKQSKDDTRFIIYLDKVCIDKILTQNNNSLQITWKIELIILGI